MKRALILLALTGCSWFAQNQAYFPSPNDLACVATDVERGVTDPVQVLKDCPNLVALSLADLEALITGQMQAKALRAK